MVIDDAPHRREEQYKEVFRVEEFDILYIWSRQAFEQHRETPVDGYVIDVFLDEGDWKGTSAAALLQEIQNAPRPAPIFFVSQFWGEDRMLGILKQAGESSTKVVQYLAWNEFEEAAGDDEAAKLRMDALRNKLLFELRRWHSRSGFRPGPNDTIQILLLADVQFGDPSTDPTATFSEHWIARTLREEHRLPNLIVIAGDLTHSGRPDQFALAEERLTLDLFAQLWGQNNIDRMSDRIVLVPGNHDVNLRFSACDGYKFDLTRKILENDPISIRPTTNGKYLCHHDYALEPFRRFARSLTRDRSWEDSMSLSWVDRRFLHCGIRFFVFNTVSELSASAPDLASFSEPAVREITRSLSDDEPGSIFSIAVSHHGLRPLGSDNQTQVNNWTRVGQDAFAIHRIPLWIYGHYHQFEARSINSKPFDKTPLWLVQVPTSRISSPNRGFCLLELRRDSGKVVDAYVHHYVLGQSSVEKKDASTSLH
jgi:3',5'-cyclic AMP phosphodiesterase CpdA